MTKKKKNQKPGNFGASVSFPEEEARGEALPGVLPALDDLGRAAHAYKAAELTFLKASTEKSNAAKHLINMLVKQNKRSIRIGRTVFQHRKSKECIVIKNLKVAQ